MEIVGYFLALPYLQALGGRSPDLQDLSVKIANLGTLANDLRNYPEFNPESFKKNRINRVGDVGMFLTSNLLEYCLYGKGNPDNEGVVVTFKYKTLQSSGEGDKDEPDPTYPSFLFRKEGLSEDLVRPLLLELNNDNSRRNKFIIIRNPKA